MPLHSSSAYSTSTGSPNYSNSGSWGLGVVIPQGAEMAGDSTVRWQNANNITALVHLPEINMTDAPIFVVVSLMTSTGSVIQAAAGLYQNASTWESYSMYIQNPLAYPQTYKPIPAVNQSPIAAGGNISISIFLSSGVWNMKLSDLDTDKSTNAIFNSSLSQTLKDGDQEVFTLESYSSNSSIFENMTNLTLYSVLINGQRVLGGWYYYGSWEMSHNPLFIVGGLNPPSFISVQEGGSSSSIWSYSTTWSSVNYGAPVDLRLLIVVLLGFALGAILLVVVLTKVKNVNT